MQEGEHGLMDIIFIREFRVEAWVGIYEWEKLRAQTVELEIEIGIPGNAAGKSDKIEDTIHYGLVAERVTKDLAEKRFQMLEALAEHVAGLITGEFRAPWVKVSVAKLGLIRNVRKVGVTIERGRKPEKA
jgi:dihydroneopterin aldolase